MGGPSASRTFAIANSLVLRNRENLVTPILGGLQYAVFLLFCLYCVGLCPALDPPHNGKIQTLETPIRNGTVIMLVCNVDFELSGTAAISCLPSGVYSKELGSCVSSEYCRPRNDES